MSNTVRQAFLLFVLAVALAGVAAWSWSNLRRHSVVAERAAEDLLEVQQLSRQILMLRDRPTIAGSHELEISELSERIEEAAKSAQIPGGSLVRIWPEPARRIGDSPYKEKPTQILLRHVSLRQIMGFLHALSSESVGLTVKNLRIVAPHRQEEADQSWTAEALLTYLIYEPQSTAALSPQTGGR